MVVMRDTMPETTPLFVAIMRLLPAGIALLMFRYFMKPQAPNQPWHPQGWQGWVGISLFALIDGTCFQGFLAEGLMDTGAGLGSVLIDSQPLAVALMACWFFQERMGRLGWLSLLIGLSGIGVIGLSGTTSLSISMGEGWMLLAALAMAMGTVMMRPLSQYVDPVIATGWHMILGSLPLIAVALVTHQLQWETISPNHWWGLIYTSLLGSALAYGIFFYFASQEKLTEFSSLTFLTPVFALIFGWWFLHEMLSLTQWVGVGITLLSVYLLNHRFELTQRLQQIKL